ncbi:hypothetical protein M9Y10_014150 [Tritrichomonas musculus]|uniref:Initiator binding domain-containing protein n=1 Tax=Tritrichomonas musculus TaxID=1915356 RepID=A0ABR2KZK1_9EUKA
MIVNTYCYFPRYWNLLSAEDRYKYTVMRAEMSSPSNKNQRNKRIETFSDALDKIKNFAIRDESDDWKRCLVCGICWLPEGIAINTHQLKILIFKCKSSINGSLQKMGYNVTLGRTEAANAMTSSIPFLKNSSSELRQWTVRKKSEDGSENSDCLKNVDNENKNSKTNDDDILILSENEIQNPSSPEVISPPPNNLFDQNVFINFENEILQNDYTINESDVSSNSSKIIKGKDEGNLNIGTSNFETWDSQNLLFPDNFWGCF